MSNLYPLVTDLNRGVVRSRRR